jgi:L-rhamnose isomerase
LLGLLDDCIKATGTGFVQADGADETNVGLAFFDKVFDQGWDKGSGANS